jgi:glycyl-tRNA synthetase beta chain
MKTRDFLLEIGCEELPASAQQSLVSALVNIIKTQLEQAEIKFKNVVEYSTPRRLALIINGLDTEQPEKIIERFGPSSQAAFDKQGQPTLACLGFAKSCGVSVEQLEIKPSPKGERVFCCVKQAGKPIHGLLPEIVKTAIKKLPISKPMRWGDSEIAFIRPVHWVVMIFGSELIKAEILGVATSKETRGHRFHHPKPIKINQPGDYQQLLYTYGMVIVDHGKRKNLIKKQILEVAKPVGTPQIDEQLLDEVASLVEWPEVLLGKFDKKFLGIPQEALITSMKTHQKCFTIVNKNNELEPCFILVSNIKSTRPELVIAGNERVINARLADASFFYEKDKKTTLSDRFNALNFIVFQKSLGTLADKSHRISKLAIYLAKQFKANTELAHLAGHLAKCDLVTEMVGEFPELQGIMGSYYAKASGEPSEVALAIKEHYHPRFSGDKTPDSVIGSCVALADKIDTLVGILGINKIPTGDKDPFALRRAAVSILRIIIEGQFPIDLLDLITEAKNGYTVPLPNPDVLEQTFTFISDRLRAWYLDKGILPEIFASVLACHPTKLVDFDQRIAAVKTFHSLPEASALAAANKRVSNILKKQTAANIPKDTDAGLFTLDAEKKLAEVLKEHRTAFNSYYQQADYSSALNKLSTLKLPVDDFFDSVMIMVDDKKIRNNRLALLTSLRYLFTQVADISLLP